MLVYLHNDLKAAHFFRKVILMLRLMTNKLMIQLGKLLISATQVQHSIPGLLMAGEMYTATVLKMTAHNSVNNYA